MGKIEDREDVQLLLRGKLKELLSQCTEKQQAFFDRMYRCPVDEFPMDKIDHAIWQCENTIRKNKTNA